MVQQPPADLPQWTLFFPNNCYVCFFNLQMKEEPDDLWPSHLSVLHSDLLHDKRNHLPTISFGFIFLKWWMIHQRRLSPLIILLPSSPPPPLLLSHSGHRNNSQFSVCCLGRRRLCFFLFLFFKSLLPSSSRHHASAHITPKEKKFICH